MSSTDMTEDDMMKTFGVLDGDQTIKFDGTLLASASTRQDDSLRWTEIELYRTQAGKYVVHKTGRTRVVHASAGTCKYGVAGQLIPANVAICPVCQPTVDEIAEGAFTVEQDRHTTHVSETAQGVIESLYSQDEDGVTYMTRIARRVLRLACVNDAALNEAFMVRHIA